MPNSGQDYTRSACSSLPGAGTDRVRLSGHACLSVQRPGSPCRKCAEACPVLAIQIAERQIEVDMKSCIGCGRCAASCPTEALAVAGFHESSGCVPDDQPIRLKCSRMPSPEQTPSDLIVPCLGGISPGYIRTMLATSNERIAMFDHGWCATCPAGGRAAPWADVLERACTEWATLHPGSLFPIRVEHHPLPSGIALNPPKPAQTASDGLTRRGLFTQLPQPREMEPARVSAEGRVPGIISVDSLRSRRQQLARMACNQPLPAALFPSIVVADSCCSSQVCISSCPTEALKPSAESAARGIDFDAALCVACGICAVSCPTESISLRSAGEGYYQGPVPVARRQLQTCAECGLDFVPADDHRDCLACRKDAEVARLGHGLMRIRNLDGSGASKEPAQRIELVTLENDF